jgi:hypothetical protein
MSSTKSSEIKTKRKRIEAAVDVCKIQANKEYFDNFRGSTVNNLSIENSISEDENNLKIEDIGLLNIDKSILCRKNSEARERNLNCPLCHSKILPFSCNEHDLFFMCSNPHSNLTVSIN